MILKVLASGSKGNSTLIRCGNINLLIDIGINYKSLCGKLEEENLLPQDIDAVFITHCHSDHIKGLSTFIRKTNLEVYIHQNLVKEMLPYISRDNMKIVTDEVEIDDIKINYIPLSHDVTAYGFIIEYLEASLVYITDTGYIHKKYYSILSNKNIYVIEANHDVEMLMNGPYPYYLKQRVVGDYGHLSNESCGNMLKHCIGSKTKYVLLAHISENNNTKEVAYKAVCEILEDVPFDKEKVIITDQYDSTELIEV